MSEHPSLEHDLQQLEVALRKLENAYTMYFAGTLPKPPVNDRARVERLLRRYDRAFIQSYADRFRLTTLQARFNKFAELWDRGMRAREEGRPGPFFRAPRQQAPPAPEPTAPTAPAEQVMCVTTVTDPSAEPEKVTELYRSLLDARKALGQEEPFPYQRFVEMVSGQVDRLRKAGSREVAFRVAVKDGKLAFSAKGTKGRTRGSDG